MHIYCYVWLGQESAAYQLAFIIAASLFNLSYVILVNMVLGAIIAGLIIDTFSQMRSENEAIEADMQVSAIHIYSYLLFT